MSYSSENKFKSITSSNKSATEFLLERFEILEAICQDLTQSIKQVNDEIQTLRSTLMEVVETDIPAESQSVFPDDDLKLSATPKKKFTASTKTTSLEDEEVITEPLFPLRKKEPVTPRTRLSKAEFVNAINTLPLPELEEKLALASAKRNVIKNILNERKKINFRHFESMDDIVRRIKGLAEHSLEKITEQWS